VDDRSGHWLREIVTTAHGNDSNCNNYSNDVYYRKYSKQEAIVPQSRNSYTTSDLSRKSGDIIAEALRHPVTITQRNKPRLVLLNIEDYQRLVKGSDSRSVGTIDAISDQLLEEFETAVDAYAGEDEAGRS
jgi:prevent-host-death family protein